MQSRLTDAIFTQILRKKTKIWQTKIACMMKNVNDGLMITLFLLNKWRIEEVNLADESSMQDQNK